jgi:serine/threonine protein kinase/Tfp pilus assembly protein PilF
MNERDIFIAARAQSDPAECAAFLDRACGEDHALRARVEALLHEQDKLGSFLERPAAGVADTGAYPSTPDGRRPAAPAEGVGTIIGPYKLLEAIGEGGMGTVYLAQQSGSVKRLVALKLIKPGMASRPIIARFEAERQALALMDHPNIARVFDAGATDSGRPYFVMELVKGLPITEYCDQAQHAPRERLELFVHLCQAVQHAHQKGIIHRDVKPSNVLVTVHDTMPVVKVIDFGVAKALGQELTDKTLYTGIAQMVGTPLYMSPEQAGQSGLDVDTRSDIYSLGVLLYELLTGTTPFDRERLKAVGYEELLRIIREEDPPRPSTRISTLAKAASTVATCRKSDPRRLSQLCRGELDWIVMKALEKDRNRRYESANALTADVQRYLNDEPVQACPPSAWYRLRKFARRKKTALVIAACVFLAFVGIAGSIGWAMRDRTAREEGIEHERLAREAALDQTVDRALNEAEPLIDAGKWPEALAAVERADKLLVLAGRTERPTRLLELRQELSLAEHLDGIQRLPKRILEASLIPARGHGLEDWIHQPLSAEEASLHERQADAAFSKAFRECEIDMDALTPAEAAARIGRFRVRAALVKALDEWAPLRRGGTSLAVSNPRWTKLVEAARLADPDPQRNRCREAVLRRDRPALEQLADAIDIQDMSPKTLWLLGLTLREVGALDRAMRLLQRAQHQYPTDLWINELLGHFSWNAFQPRRTEDALRYYSIALALRPERPKLHLMMVHILTASGALDEAVAECSKIIELEPNSTLGWTFRGNLYSQLKQPNKSLADFDRAIAVAPKEAVGWSGRGWAYHQLGQFELAESDLNTAVALDPESWPAWTTRAIVHNLRKEYGKALDAFTKVIDLNPTRALGWSSRARVYDRLNEHDKALADYTEAIRLEPESAPAWNERGRAYAQLRNYAKALPDLNKAIDLDGLYMAAWLNRGHVHNELKQRSKALADYTRATDLSPKTPAPWNGRGWVYVELQQFDLALADLNKGLAIEPRDPRALRNRGYAHNELKHYDEALADYAAAIKFSPDYADAWMCRAITYWRLGDWARSQADAATALRLQPDSHWNQNCLAWVLAACPEASLRDPPRAVELAEKAVKSAPREGTFWATLAVARYRAGDWQGTAAAAQEALKLLQGAGFHWGVGRASLFLAMAQLRLEKTQDARQTYARALAWLEKNRKAIENVPATAAELHGFRREAEKLLTANANDLKQESDSTR